MSYKVKSLLYFTAFVASVLIYDTMNDDIPDSTVAKSPELEKSISENSMLQAQGQALLLEEAMLNN